MYEQHYNFTSPPFSIAPNPRFIYLSSQHREALAHLLFGISAGGGFVALTGEVGTGKTTLCRCLLEQLPEDVDIALIFNPRLNAKELLASLCDELHIPHPEHKASIKQLIDRLNHHLLETHARGRRTVALIDEAQNLSYDVLEQIRLLTNLETNETKLLQIILVGQPELQSLLDRPQLRQLSQRITARYHLRPLSLRDTEAYIEHRLAVSGVRLRLFTRPAVRAVYRRSCGIPRLINLICDRALLGAYTLGKFVVTPGIVRKAAGEVLPPPPRSRSVALTLGSVAVALALAAVLQRLGYFSLADLLDQGSPAASASGSVTPPPVAALPSPAGVAADQPLAAAASPAPMEAGSTPSPTPATPAELPSVPEPPRTGSFAEISGELPTNRENLFTGLLTLWGAPPPAQGMDGCVHAKAQGLRCLELDSGWDQLLSLNRPAILELVTADGTTRHVILSEAADDTALLRANGREYRIAQNDLKASWHGQATLLWKPPFGKASMGLGDKGETVQWVRDRLNLPAAPGAVFDDRLKSRVIAFQKERGLLQDGQVGPLTMLNLQELDPALQAPRLRPRRD